MIKENNLSNALRFLSIDMVEKANSGHPGMPMGMADIATVLWLKHLNHNPQNPDWINRDRFILSNGHGSALLYSLLHLSGYDLSISDLKAFRQLNSKTPGHPEYHYTPGVETTTGPLGQGLANGVGMALAEQLMSNKFNKDDLKLIDHHSYVFVGDGCLMEGISHEVCALAGVLNLGKLVVFWDDNGISIDGETKGWFTENVPDRFRSYNWHVIENIDGHDHDQIDKAIISAKNEKNKPTLICCKTTIGFGSPNKSGKSSVHGAPLGSEEIAKTKKYLDWNNEAFEIPDDIYNKWDSKESGNFKDKSWQDTANLFASKYPLEHKEFLRRISGENPKEISTIIDKYIDELIETKIKVATRKSSQLALEKLIPNMPELFGGSADLTGSNLTATKDSVWLNTTTKNANYLSYGVREFGMSAIMNGLSLYGGIKPYGGTFLVFSDYARNAIRMSAIMHQPVIYVMTHDSIGLGEDGPTHQPVEHLPSLRLIPNLNVWRPADAIETLIAWERAISERKSPSLLSLSRHNLPTVVSCKTQINSIRKGGYILLKTENPSVNLVATGSEVEIALQAQKQLKNMNINANVVSMPCVEIFKKQSNDYKNETIINIPSIFIEASQPDLWYSLMPKAGGDVVGISSFGESAPASELYNKFNITAQCIVDKALGLI